MLFYFLNQNLYSNSLFESRTLPPSCTPTQPGWKVRLPLLLTNEYVYLCSSESWCLLVQAAMRTILSYSAPQSLPLLA